MSLETLTLKELVAPTLFVVAVIYILGPVLPMERQWARVSIVGFAGIMLVRYLHWRIFSTVLPMRSAWYEFGWTWLCLVVELLGLIDLAILMLTFTRVKDRSPEADIHERRLRAMTEGDLPSVDVFIPTYNESLQVLEKTVTGALCLDYQNYKVWVLDDGRRRWLRKFCEDKGVGYLTRPDNAHAKAGNINHALKATDGELVAVFDADFVPQADFLIRTVGFFADARVGIVQVPHSFYNNDPMQTNLALRNALPHDQAFFFKSIMPSRDAWDTAFCCGSNSITRRAALDSIGGGLPTASITEDILLTMTLLREGYVTRYLCEPLAYGLAPESIDAFFVQRQRWARGGIQTMYLGAGPFGPGLSFAQRLMFIPIHWLSQSLVLVFALLAPLVFLWTGLPPLVNVTPETELYYLLPTILATVGSVWLFAPRYFMPLAAYVLGTFQAFRLLPHVLSSVVKPFGQMFKVTPKGQDAVQLGYAQGIFWSAASLMVLTIAGLIFNTIPEFQLMKTTGLLATLGLFAGVNVLVLFLVCMMSLQAPMQRAEERFALDELVWVLDAADSQIAGRSKDLSMSGIGIFVKKGRDLPPVGTRVKVFISEVGFVAGFVVRHAEDFMSVQFDLPSSIERDLLIRKLFTSGREAVAVSATAWSATGALLSAVWSHRSARPTAPPAEPPRVQEAKLPAESLVVMPRQEAGRLAAIGAQRRELVA